MRHAEDVPRLGVLNKCDKPQSIPRSLLDGKCYLLRGRAEIDRAYLLEDSCGRNM
jgi:hypothetical protein